MRCDHVLEILAEGDPRAREIKEHLAQCPACAARARAWRLAQAGFRELASEPVPEASVGFTPRLMRRLAESSRPAPAEQSFFEKVGRRFVYSTLMLALLALLALAVPRSGPLRSPNSAEMMLMQPSVATLQDESVLNVDGLGSHWPHNSTVTAPAAGGQR